MKYLIIVLAFLMRPFYKAAEEAKHNVAKEGALFYVRDVQRMDDHLKKFAVSCAEESQNEMRLELKKYINDVFQHEKEELRDWLHETIDKRMEVQDLAVQTLLTDLRKQLKLEVG